MLLRFHLIVAADIAKVFGFHEDPAHLALLMKGRHGFRLLRHDGSIAPGSMTWFQETIATLVPVTMGFRHTTLQAPHSFAEEMVRGPFQRFAHVHEFADSNEGTEVTDIVELSLPWHYGGEPATTRFVAPVIRAVFAHRHAALLRIFGVSDVAVRGGSSLVGRS